MNLHILPFGKIIIKEEDLAEVIINEGVEMDEKIVRDYHNFLVSNLKTPFSLLINKINSYTYTFEAQKLLGTIPELDAMAIVVYHKATSVATDNLIKMPRELVWNVKTFEDRDLAYQWLKEQQKLTKDKLD